MDRQYSSKLLLAAAVILCTAISTCKAQDAVEIVAKAVLCFDNHTVINKCLQEIGIVSDSKAWASTTQGGGHRGAALDTSANASAAASSMCETPCFEHMMMMTGCMDDILSNFKGYSAGLIKGYRAVFLMSCKVVTAASAGSSSNATANATAAGHADDRHSPSHGSAKGGSLVSGSAATNGAGGPLRVGDLLVWTTILMVTHMAMPSACTS
uniref:Pectinesterase inhibitor domain-containing protein n=1 Tax=Leersia perrieri TaxID=77586 RepID=A0A0D9VT48_9ORYZ